MVLEETETGHADVSGGMERSQYFATLTLILLHVYNNYY